MSVEGKRFEGSNQIILICLGGRAIAAATFDRPITCKLSPRDAPSTEFDWKSSSRDDYDDDQ